MHRPIHVNVLEDVHLYVFNTDHGRVRTHVGDRCWCFANGGRHASILAGVLEYVLESSMQLEHLVPFTVRSQCAVLNDRFAAHTQEVSVALLCAHSHLLLHSEATKQAQTLAGFYLRFARAGGCLRASLKLLSKLLSQHDDACD
jgi:hypothetical protein